MREVWGALKHSNPSAQARGCDGEGEGLNESTAM